jgi:hypothetical protein
MRESRTFGSVGGEGGNVLAYPALSCRQQRSWTTVEDDPKLSLMLWYPLNGTHIAVRKITRA